MMDMFEAGRSVIQRVLPGLVAAAAFSGFAVPAVTQQPSARKAAETAAATPDIRLLLNLPGNRLYVYENGEQIAKYRVAIGMEGYETPLGEYRVSHAIWNPWWHPPDSDWARHRKVERPGSSTNPMGRIKLHFGPLLYIHGTPEEETLGRLVSRGCVRMSNDQLIGLALYLHRHFASHVPQTELDALVADPERTRRVDFRKPIRFEVVYNLAEVRDGFLFIFPDVYGQADGDLGEKVETVLAENGVDLGRVDRTKLDRLLRKGADMRVAMSLDTLTAAPNDVATDR